MAGASEGGYGRNPSRSSLALGYRTLGMDQLRAGNFRGAYANFLALTRETPDDWYAWYGAGQSARSLDDFAHACELLERAAMLNGREPAVLLALGIAQQLAGRLDDAVRTLLAAIEIDQDFAAAYNSLALTQRKQGELEAALHNYEAGTLALARKFVRSMHNSRSSAVTPFEYLPGQQWTDCAVFGAMFHGSAVEPVKRVVFPTGEQAEQFERTGEHGGLFYIDQPTRTGSARLFLPNYFHTFREYLRSNDLFANLIGNRGTCFEMLGRHAEAEASFAEARAFSGVV